ncbi:MAG: PKD domain-containing protein, partial [Sphingobacteriaceae bacterium]
MKPTLLFLCFSFIFSPLFSQQYTINGNAESQGCNCYRLTKDINDQSGSVWNNNQINLNNSFDYNFDVYLGANDGGADGIAFVLQPVSTSVGSLGGGMGYSGITPAIGVTLDTYQNSSPDSDPFYDHIAIQRNGDINHASANNLAGPVQASATNANIEDGALHKLRVVWDATTKTLSIYFDAVQRLSIVNDLVNTTFGANPMVYWGFTGATGGLSNEQRFCTALTPAWTFSPTQKRCVGEPIQFTNASISFTTIAKIYWTFGDTPDIDSVNLNPVHTYASAGTYTVTQRIKGADGCEATNTQTVIVGSKPVADFRISDTCVNTSIQFINQSSVTVGSINSWYWDLDNAGATSTLQQPFYSYPSSGIKNIKLFVSSLQGCTSDTLYKAIRIFSRPVLDFTFTDSVCLGSPTGFFGTLLTGPDPVTHWAWNFGDTSSFIRTTQNASFIFSTPGPHSVTFYGTSTENAGCIGPITTKTVFVTDKPRAAIKAFTGCEDIALTLQDSSYTLDGLPITAWWWDLGNGQFSNQQNPGVTYTTAGPINIQLVVWNSKGCKSDTLRTTINVFAKPEVDFSITDSCLNNTIQFNGLISTGSGNAAAWYWWLDNAGATSTDQNPTSLYSSAGTKNIKLVAINFNGCASDTLFKPIRIYDKPTVNFTFQDSVCLGSPINFAGTVVSSMDPITNWQWTFDGSNPANTQNSSFTFLTPGNHTVSLSASTTGAASCYGATIQKNIFIIDKPRAAIKKAIACQAVNTQLLDSSYTTDGLPITAWWWDLGNGQFSTQQNPSLTYNATGVINVQLVVWNSKGCKSDTLKTAIKVYGVPTADFTWTAPACNSNVI